MVSLAPPSTRLELIPAQSLSPATLRRLLRELNALANAPPEGIRLAKETLGDEDGEGDMSDVRAWVEGPVGTPYAGEYVRRTCRSSGEIRSAGEKRLGCLLHGLRVRMWCMEWMEYESQVALCRGRMCPRKRGDGVLSGACGR